MTVVRPRWIVPVLCSLAAACSGVTTQHAPAAGAASPPVARIVPRTDTLHGEVRTDDYFWLRDRDNPETIAYLEAENRYTDAAMAHTESLQETLYGEMLGRIQQTDLSVPEKRGPYWYYSRTVEGEQYPIFARKRGSLDAPEEVLLDQNEMARGIGYFRIYAMTVSPDHRRLAFSVDTAGSERLTLMVKDLASGTILPDRVDDIHFGLVWAADNQTLFYTRTDASHRPDRVLRHALGSDPASDPVVYREPDVLFRASVTRSKDDRYLFFGSYSSTTAEVHFVPADRPTAPLRVIEPRAEGVQYSVEHADSSFVIRTNEGGATNFKLMRAPVATPGRAAWRELVAHRDSVLLEGFTVFRDHLVMYERGGARTGIRVREWRGGAEHEVSFPEPVYTVGGGGNPEYNTAVLRFTYTSLVTPSSVFDYDMRRRTRELRKQIEVLGGFDPSRYGTERIWARAEDGTRVPVSLVYREPLVRDGSRPLLLYAYGSYGSSADPAFSSNNLSLLDRGVIYAIAHVRGGQEMGRGWYDAGKMLNKKNTFSDFVAVADHLVRERYTSPERLAARGGSAGGLLMGAVVNLRPELFRAVIADVPFVDVVNTMLDASIPLTTGEWLEWGNPRDPEQYAYIRGYSPYDNVQRKAYPTMLVTTGLNDPRVAYWEPAKWVAKLRTHKTDRNPLLLKTNLGAGHGGASGRYDALREQAFRYAFLLDALGIPE
ncbi:MAG: S9 family peptidase [Gemmatimonadota bacterium]|nr:S9 family peptidase [Gemmatimonadota bacterium]